MGQALAIVVAAAGLGAGAPAAEVIENCLGLTFSADDPADVVRWTPVPTFSPFHHYVYLANPTPTTLGGFEFAWRIDAPDGAPSVTVLDVAVLGVADYAGDVHNYVVRCETPMPTAELVVLVDLTLMYVTSPVEAYLWLGPPEPAAIPGSAAIFDGADPAVAIATGFPAGVVTEPDGWGIVAAYLNPPAAETATWSTVKALYAR